MSQRTNFLGVDLDDARYYMAGPKTAWPNDCPDARCGFRMEFDFSAARTVRRCPACGTTVHAHNGELIVTRASAERRAA